MKMNSKEEFVSTADKVWSERPKPMAFAVGIASTNRKGETLDVLYPLPNLRANFGAAAMLALATGYEGGTAVYELSRRDLSTALSLFSPFRGDPGHANIDLLETISEIASDEVGMGRDRKVIVCFIGEDEPPKLLEDVYLRLHLISHRLVRPNEINLDGIFGILRNVAWTDRGAVDLTELSDLQMAMRMRGEGLRVFAVDKLPHMLDYVAPSGVRVGDASRVRLGAHLGEGTTVMQEGFCNFNAGTRGSGMIEGRISAGVIIDDGTDLGGGCSTMGTLSGGGKEKIRIGKGCLLGANSGTGISLGDFCVVQAGFYLLPQLSYRVVRGELFDEVVEQFKAEKGVDLVEGTLLKGLSLSDISKTTFWQNCETGQVEAIVGRPNKERLNEMLHKN